MINWSHWSVWLPEFRYHSHADHSSLRQYHILLTCEHIRSYVSIITPKDCVANDGMHAEVSFCAQNAGMEVCKWTVALHNPLKIAWAFKHFTPSLDCITWQGHVASGAFSIHALLYQTAYDLSHLIFTFRMDAWRKSFWNHNPTAKQTGIGTTYKTIRTSTKFSGCNFGAEIMSLE